MQKNMGQIDRILRIIIAGTIGTLYFTNSLSGLPLAVLVVAAIISLTTSSIGFCPLYRVLGISSGKAQLTKNGGSAQ